MTELKMGASEVFPGFDADIKVRGSFSSSTTSLPPPCLSLQFYLLLPMCDSTPDVVHQPIFNGMQGYLAPLFDPNAAKPFPEITALERYFQVTPMRFLSINTDSSVASESVPLEQLHWWDILPSVPWFIRHSY